MTDFDYCVGYSNLDTGMGAACPTKGCPPPNTLREAFEPGPGRDQCAARLEYSVSSWSAFWIKLPDLDLRPYDRLTFEVRADPDAPSPKGVKVELKRDCFEVREDVTLCRRTWYERVPLPGEQDLRAEWDTITVYFTDLQPPHNSSVEDMQEMQELVFTFEGSYAGREGVIYLDNVWFWQP